MPYAVTTTKSVYRAGSQFYNVDPSHVAPELVPPVIAVSGYTGALVISDNGAGGTFTLVAGHTDQWTYVPLNRTQSVVITVHDAVPNTANVTVAVTATFPLQPNFGYEVAPQLRSFVKEMKDGTPKFRRMKWRSFSWNYSFLNRIIADVAVLRDFEEWHDIDKQFYLIDVELSVTLLARLDSAVKVSPKGPNQFEMACIVKVHKVTALGVPTTYVGL